MQSDTLIPDYTNPQAWNRYSYVGNNPVNFSDPTGHFGSPPPWLELLNPFSFDTWFVSVRGALKYYIGVEGDVTAYVDMKPIREEGILGIADVKISVNVEGAISAGLSQKLHGAVVVGSTEGSTDDQSGIQIVGKDQYSTNLGGCAPQFAMCGGLETTFDKSLQKPTSKGLLFGLGEGYDVSVNIIEISDRVVRFDKKRVDVQIPILNRPDLAPIK